MISSCRHAAAGRAAQGRVAGRDGILAQAFDRVSLRLLQRVAIVLMLCLSATAGRADAATAAGGQALAASSSPLINWKASNTLRWRTALSASRTTRSARLNVYGDSLGQGVGAAAPRYQTSWVGRMQKLIEGSYPVGGSGVVPIYQATGASSEIDARKVFNGSWPYNGVGYMYGTGRYASASSDTFTFTPDEQITGFWVYYAKHPAGGTFSISVDAGAPLAVSSYGAMITPPGVTGGYARQYIAAGTLGTHTLKVTPPNGQIVMLLGVEGVTDNGVRVSRIAVSGALASYLDNTDLAPLQFGLSTPDLSVISLGMNDYLTQTAIGSYRTALAGAITRAKTSGDAMLVIEPPPGTSLPIPWSSYVTTAKAVATTADIPVVDLTAVITSYSAGSKLGLYSDLYHLSTDGYKLVGQTVAEAVLTTP